MLKGKYTLRKNGEVVGELDNLITDAAKAVILDYLSGKTKSWAGSLVVGIDNSAPVAANQYINFEGLRVPVDVREPRYTDGAVVVKATLPLNFIAEMHEVGIASTSLSGNNNSDNYIISYFNPELDEITGVSGVQGRLGPSSSQLTLAASPDDFSVDGLSVRLNSLSLRDKLRFAYDASNITDITIRMYNPDNNFVSHNFTASAGFNVQEFTVANLSGTGSLDEEISSIMVIATGGIGGTLTAEGLRFHRSSLDADDVLISHAAFAQPVLKDAGEEMDIEFTITFGGLNG